MMNHINSVKRDSLSECSPYELMENFIPRKLKELFDIEEIEQKNIILKPKLFNYKKKKQS